MTRPGHRRAAAALGVGVGVGAGVGGCGVGDVTPPAIVEAHFEGPDALDTIVVRFSEPLAPTTGVDPSVHFRVGVAFVFGDQTAYYDLNYHFPIVLPEPGADGGGQWPRHGNNYVAAIEPGDGPDELRLILAYAIYPVVCDSIVEAEAAGIPAGIHLHYADDIGPRINDEAGNPLPDLADWWVDTPGSASAQPGAFEHLDPRIEIPCPEF